MSSTTRAAGAAVGAEVREPAVAGAFYPAEPARLRALAMWQRETADRRHPLPGGLNPPVGLLVPHAGLEYSGVVAAAAWRLLPAASTVVILGTNHRAAWLDGIGAWERGAWRTPLGDVRVDGELADRIVGLGKPFAVDRSCHLGEHSIEVQLPFIQALAPASRIVPLAVAAGTGQEAIDAGVRLGRLLAERRAAGDAIVLAVSTDMAHYPSHGDAARVTEDLLRAILALDAAELARAEAAIRDRGIAGLACGMCGIEPAVVGLAALGAAGPVRGMSLAAATSAESGGPVRQTVGYLAAAFGI